MKEKLTNTEGENLKELNIQGDVYYTNFTRKYENRTPWKKPDVKQVFSFIPGTIREILVKEGDSVVLNQKLFVLEAMKMMNSVQSPMTGKIKSISVSVGDCIPKGTLLLEFE